MTIWHTLTSFGDLAITAPAALAVAAWLMLAGERRLAMRWIVLLAAGMVIAAATKVAFIGWGIGIRSLNFTGVSGHAARAAAVFPVLCFLIAQKSSPLARRLCVLAGCAFAAVVGLSRIVLHTHSASEVMSGLVLGGAVSYGFIRSASALQAPVLNRLRIGCCLALLLAAPYAQPTPTQQWLTAATLYLSGHDQPFVRMTWRFGHPHKHGRRAL